MAVKKEKEKAKKIKITLVKSTIGCSEKQKATVEALGLKKIRQCKEHDDTPVTRGMIFVVKHLICVEEA
ncbi:MAG: 50S ribosomal protein L30 [Firmicutes bacterium]|nr:50S ribosomal protein L30 [Bacillota bacterium]